MCVCFEKKIELLLSLDHHTLLLSLLCKNFKVKHYSKSIKDINIRLGILAYHDMIQLQTSVGTTCDTLVKLSLNQWNLNFQIKNKYEIWICQHLWFLLTGSKWNAVYDAATNFVKSKCPELLDKMTKNVGFAMGIEFREGSMLMTAKSHISVWKSKYMYSVINVNSWVYYLKYI